MLFNEYEILRVDACNVNLYKMHSKIIKNMQSIFGRRL